MYRHGFYTNEAHEERLACARAPTEVARGAAYSKTGMKVRRAEVKQIRAGRFREHSVTPFEIFN